MNIKIFMQSIFVLILISGCTNEELPEKNAAANEIDQSGSMAQVKEHAEVENTGGVSQKIGLHLNEAETFELLVENGRLTTRINDAPLGLVLKELGRQARIKIFINASVTEVIVTANLNDILLEQGIKQLLSKQNYTLVYEEVDAANIDSDQGVEIPHTRIAELRIVSESEPIIDVKTLSKQELLAEASDRQKERELYAFKARVEDALSDSDNVALDELKQEILNHENPEAAAELFDEALEEYQSESEEYQVGTLGVFGTATSSGQSSTSGTVAQTSNNGNNLTSDSSQSQSTSPLTNNDLTDMPELRADAKKAFATGDPREINKVVRDVVTSDDIERAIDAFTKEAVASGFAN